MNGTRLHHQGFGLARVFHRFGQTLGVLAAVFEFQAVHRLDFLSQFHTTVRVQQTIDAITCFHTQVVIAFGTHVFIGLQIGFVQNLFARRTFHPQTIRHR